MRTRGPWEQVVMLCRFRDRAGEAMWERGVERHEAGEHL